MRLQDLQFYRDPLYSYGPILSQGEESGCQAFHDNPGNGGNWSNTYEQWTGAQAWQAYQVHGGPKSVVAKLAHYAECDLKGTLAKFDTNHNDLIDLHIFAARVSDLVTAIIQRITGITFARPHVGVEVEQLP